MEPSMSGPYAYSNPLYDYIPFNGSDTETPKPTPMPRKSVRRRLVAIKQVAIEIDKDETGVMFDREKEFEHETGRMVALLDEIEIIANSFSLKLGLSEKNVPEQSLAEKLEAALQDKPQTTFRPVASTSRKRVPVCSALLKMQFSSVSTMPEEDIDESHSHTSSSSSFSEFSSSSSPLSKDSGLDSEASKQNPPKLVTQEDSPPSAPTPPPQVPMRGPPKHPLPPIPVEPKPNEPEESGKLRERASKTAMLASFNIRFELLSLEHLHGSNHKLQRQGCLWKTGPNYRTFKNRWCVLSRHAFEASGQMMYFSNQQNMSLAGKIVLADVEFIGVIESISNKTRLPKLSVSEQTSSIKNEFSFFKLGVRNRCGRIYLFAARSHSELQNWLHTFFQTLALHSVKNKEIYLCGFLRTRFTIAGRWQPSLALLTTDRCVYFFEISSGSEMARVVDCKSYQIFNLRKTIRLVSFDPNGFSLTQNGGRVVYLASEFESHITHWREAVERFWRTPEVLEKSILAEQYLTKENVPVALDKCLKFLDTFNRIGGELFTEKGEKDMREFLQNISANSESGQMPVEQLGGLLAELRTNAWEVHLLPQRVSPQHVAFLMCHYLKTMNECILTDLSLAEWLQLTKVDASDLETKKTKLKRLVQMLPVVNYASLRRMIIYLANQAIGDQFSVSLCKSLIFTKHSAMVRIPLSTARALLALLIDNYLELFEVTPDEIAKELQIKRIAHLIIAQNKEKPNTQATPSKTSATIPVDVIGQNINGQKGVFALIIAIRFQQASGNVTTMNVHLNERTMASDVLDTILLDKSHHQGLTPNRLAFGLFELISHRRLERLIDEKTKILPIVLSWSNWALRYSAEACLEVRRRDSLYPFESEFMSMLNANSQSSTLKPSPSSCSMLLSVIRYASPEDVRSSRKVLAELSRTILTLFCKETNKLLVRWNLTTSVVWYVGLETSSLIHNRHMALAPSAKDSTVSNGQNEPNESTAPAITIVECGKDKTIKMGRERNNLGHALLFRTNMELCQWIRAMVEACAHAN